MRILWISLLLAANAVSANAMELPGTGLTLSGGATAVTDYRFRGVSQTRSRPALQLDLSLSHRNGLYAELWGSTIDLYDDDSATGFKDGLDVEVDAIGGWSGNILPGATLDANVTYYIYSGVTGPANYAEALASLAFALGPVGAKIGGGYFPDQKATADHGAWFYGELSTEIPTVCTMTGHLGRQTFGTGFGPGADYWEWSLTASREFGPFSAGLSYVDTNLPRGQHAGATIVGSLGLSF